MHPLNEIRESDKQKLRENKTKKYEDKSGEGKTDSQMGSKDIEG